MKTLKIMLIAAISFFSLMSCEEELPQPVGNGTIETIESVDFAGEDEEGNGNDYNAKGFKGDSAKDQDTLR